VQEFIEFKYRLANSIQYQILVSTKLWMELGSLKQFDEFKILMDNLNIPLYTNSCLEKLHDNRDFEVFNSLGIDNFEQNSRMFPRKEGKWLRFSSLCFYIMKNMINVPENNNLIVELESFLDDFENDYDPLFKWGRHLLLLCNFVENYTLEDSGDCITNFFKLLSTGWQNARNEPSHKGLSEFLFRLDNTLVNIMPIVLQTKKSRTGLSITNKQLKMINNDIQVAFKAMKLS